MLIMTVRNANFRWVSIVMLLLVGLLLAAEARAALPSAVTSRMRTINSALDAVDQALEAGQLTTADRKLKEAQRAAKEIGDRYGGKFDDTDADYQATAGRLAAAAAKVEAARGAGAEAAAAAQASREANQALGREWIDKLQPFLDRRSDQYLRIGSELNYASPEDQARSRSAAVRARALFEEYRKVQFPEKTMELRNVESGLESALKYYDRLEETAAREESSRGWEDRLGVYAEVGRGSPKYLVASATLDPEELRSRQALYEEAKAALAEYRSADFPGGKTDRLLSIEENLTRILEEFPRALEESRTMMSGGVSGRLDAVLADFDRDTAWKTDRSKNPPTIMERDLKPLREEVDRYAATVPAGDAKLSELRKKLSIIENRDAENRVVWAERTYQKPDGYSGSDLGVLREKARTTALAAYPGGEALRVTVPSADWQVEDVVEHTDTTRTALRRRVTRSLKAQVAVRDASGNVWLQGIHLAQDRTSDGGWGELRGHTTWADRMATANVGQTGP